MSEPIAYLTKLFEKADHKPTAILCPTSFQQQFYAETTGHPPNGTEKLCGLNYHGIPILSDASRNKVELSYEPLWSPM